MHSFTATSLLSLLALTSSIASATILIPAISRAGSGHLSKREVKCNTGGDVFCPDGYVCVTGDNGVPGCCPEGETCEGDGEIQTTFVTSQVLVDHTSFTTYIATYTGTAPPITLTSTITTSTTTSTEETIETTITTETTETTETTKTTETTETIETTETTEATETTETTETTTSTTSTSDESNEYEDKTSTTAVYGDDNSYETPTPDPTTLSTITIPVGPTAPIPTADTNSTLGNGTVTRYPVPTETGAAGQVSVGGGVMGIVAAVVVGLVVIF